MAKCSGITQAGTTCKGIPIDDSEYCYAHHPDHVSERRRHGSKGGKRGGRGRPISELASLRDENADIRRRLLEGELPPNIAAVAVQSINTDIRAVGAAMKAREQEELEARLGALEEALEHEGGSRSWGRRPPPRGPRAARRGACRSQDSGGLEAAIDRLEHHLTREELRRVLELLAGEEEALRDNPRYHDGSLKLDDGVALFENARKMLASAARSAYEPRPQFVTGMPGVVTNYLNRVRIGQTERGSYIVNMLSPTTQDLEQEQLFSTEPFEPVDSFERRVTRTLARALEATRSVVGQSVQDPLLTKFEEAVPVGVSANLCEAIATIGQSGGNTGVEVDLRWALSRSVENERDLNVSFRAIDIPVIEEAGKRLRSAPSREDRIEGYVTRLSRVRGLAEEGTITIRGLIEDQLRRITVELNPPAYQRAVRAHEEDRRVACYGRLERRGKSFYLRDPRRFQILIDEEEDPAEVEEERL